MHTNVSGNYRGSKGNMPRMEALCLKKSGDIRTNGELILDWVSLPFWPSVGLLYPEAPCKHAANSGLNQFSLTLILFKLAGVMDITKSTPCQLLIHECCQESKSVLRSPRARLMLFLHRTKLEPPTESWLGVIDGKQKSIEN